MGVILHKHFGLLNTHRRLPASFPLTKFAPRSTKEVKVNLSLQVQHWKQTKGQLASIRASETQGKAWVFSRWLSGSWGMSVQSRMGISQCAAGLEVNGHTQLPELEKHLEGRALFPCSFLETQNLVQFHRTYKFQIIVPDDFQQAKHRLTLMRFLESFPSAHF